VATILKDMKASTGIVARYGLLSFFHIVIPCRKEFENSCMIVQDYFADLFKKVRCTTVESFHATIDTLQIFDAALNWHLDDVSRISVTQHKITK
jgi:hypothetical protein